MPRADDVSVRRRLTHCEVRETFISELLRRFGVSGRKRSYQTLLVAARSSRRPFSFYAAVWRGLSSESQLLAVSPLGRLRALPCAEFCAQAPKYSPLTRTSDQNEVGAACFQTAPPTAFRSSGIYGAPGVRMGCQIELLEKQ